jgi:acyl-CoA thioester hydrolase
VVFTVQSGDIDGLGHVNNLVYLRWVQEVATSHWNTIATREDQEAITWVVVRHEIDYLRSAVEGDRVAALTWVEGWTGATSERHTEIRRLGDGEILARAVTRWCALDPVSGRPRRINRGTTLPFLEAE